jgi:hypothetical protein
MQRLTGDQLFESTDFLTAACGDPGLLRVALENLFGNEWKFTSRIPQARIEFGMAEHKGKAAYFVRDNEGAAFYFTLHEAG